MEYREPTDAERKAFLKAAKVLAKLCDAGLSMYLQEDDLHLMAGPAHDENDRPQQQNVRETVWLSRAGGGAW